VRGRRQRGSEAKRQGKFKGKGFQRRGRRGGDDQMRYVINRTLELMHGPLEDYDAEKKSEETEEADVEEESEQQDEPDQSGEQKEGALDNGLQGQVAAVVKILQGQ
jgi:hypothetical protein